MIHLIMHADEMTSLFMKNKIITPEIFFALETMVKQLDEEKDLGKRLRLLLK